MGESRAVMVPLMGDKDLRFLLQTPESRGMNNAVAIALKRRSGGGMRLLNETAARLFPMRRENYPLFRNVWGHYLSAHEQCHFI